MGDRLKDKVAIVTGAGSVGPGWGNGKATAVLFAREGAEVLAVDINLAAAEETKSIIVQEGGDCTVCQVDVSQASQVKAMAEQCIEQYWISQCLLLCVQRGGKSTDSKYCDPVCRKGNKSQLYPSRIDEYPYDC